MFCEGEICSLKVVQGRFNCSCKNGFEGRFKGLTWLDFGTGGMTEGASREGTTAKVTLNGDGSRLRGQCQLDNASPLRSPRVYDKEGGVGEEIGHVDCRGLLIKGYSMPSVPHISLGSISIGPNRNNI